MPRLRPSDADREKFGCPEYLPIALGSVTNREAIALRGIGFPTPGLWAKALQSRPETVEGQTVYIVNYEAWTGLVWIALRRAGVETDLATLEFDYENLQWLKDEEAPQPESSGKAPARGRSTSSTKTSSTRGATSKPRSTSTGSRS